MNLHVLQTGEKFPDQLSISFSRRTLLNRVSYLYIPTTDTQLLTNSWPAFLILCCVTSGSSPFYHADVRLTCMISPAQSHSFSIPETQAGSHRDFANALSCPGTTWCLAVTRFVWCILWIGVFCHAEILNYISACLVSHHHAGTALVQVCSQWIVFLVMHKVPFLSLIL